ncbi:unnamed protein product [Cunninghamella blakesleeana]
MSQITQRFALSCRNGLQQQQQQIYRSFSTSMIRLEKERVYGEGFAPPKGSRDTIKQVHRRRHIATSLPSHLGNAAKTEKDASSLKNSPKKQYREQLRQTRHQYAQELLQLQGQRDAAAATKRMENDERIQQYKQSLEKEKQQHLIHEKEVVSLLSGNGDDQKNVDDTFTSDQQYNLIHQKERDQRRLEHEKKNRQERLRLLVKMYHATEHFVTLDNLDQRVDMLIAHKANPPMYTLDELMVSPTAEADEINDRKQLLNEVMGL